MSSILYIEINVVSIIILCLLLSNMRQTMPKNRSIDQKIFRFLMIFISLVFVFDSGMWYFNGKSEMGFFQLNVISTVCYYMLNPVICFLWLLYTDMKVFESRKGLIARIPFYAIPVAVSALISIASLFTGWFFQVDRNNHYSRGPFFVGMALACLFYLILSFGIAIWDLKQNNSDEDKNVQFHLTVFPVIMLVVSIIQILFFGISIIWVSCMLESVSIYINIQNGEISTDHLTGLFNRRYLETHLKRMYMSIKNNRMVFAIMLDLDKFKFINDTYGHQAGDQILVVFAELLQKSVQGYDDYIFRMGGDEYLIIGTRKEQLELDQLIEQIVNKVTEYNQKSIPQKQIFFSMGSAVLMEGDTLDSLIVKADQSMYVMKQSHKQL